MRFQIAFKIHREDHFTTNAVFVINADNWDDAACKASLLKQAMGLNPEQVQSEIIYASKDHDMIRSGSLHRVETVFNPTPVVKDVLPPLERCLEMLLRKDRNTVTDDEHPNHFVNTPLDPDQRKAVQITAAYLRRINDQAQGVHRLNTREIEVSLFFSAMFAIPVYLFKDGEWICEAVDHTKHGGSGPLPSDAINDFIRVNNMHDKKLIALG